MARWWVGVTTIVAAVVVVGCAPPPVPVEPPPPQPIRFTTTFEYRWSFDGVELERGGGTVDIEIPFGRGEHECGTGCVRRTFQGIMTTRDDFVGMAGAEAWTFFYRYDVGPGVCDPCEPGELGLMQVKTLGGWEAVAASPAPNGQPRITHLPGTDFENVVAAARWNGFDGVELRFGRLPS